MLPIALTIAGSDSGGGAGIQADLKTFQAFGVYGASVVTALTAQNTRGVAGVHAVAPEFVRLQLDAVLEDLPPAAVKSGMLATAAIVRAVAEGLRDAGVRAYVLDPVMAATSGDRLLDPDGVRAILEELVPLAALVTPNLDEAELLTGIPARDEAGMRGAAAALVDRGASAALIKGGHLSGDRLTDLLLDRHGVRVWRRERVRTRSTHGTGCTLSAAIAAGLARGRPVDAAIEEAIAYVDRALRAAPGLGAGHGPLNHMVPGPASLEISG